jgi:hypothetical protein
MRFASWSNDGGFFKTVVSILGAASCHILGKVRIFKRYNNCLVQHYFVMSVYLLSVPGHSANVVKLYSSLSKKAY